MMREWHTTFGLAKLGRSAARGEAEGEAGDTRRIGIQGMRVNRRQRRVVEVLLVASVLLAVLGLGYLALASFATSEEDQLVRSGIQQIVICRKGSSGSGDILHRIQQEIPSAGGTWGFEKDGDCRILRHYADTGPAD